VIIRRDTTLSGALVKKLLYEDISPRAPSLRHGNLYEDAAITKLEAQENLKIDKCGLFIHPDFPFLGKQLQHFTHICIFMFSNYVFAIISILINILIQFNEALKTILTKNI